MGLLDMVEQMAGGAGGGDNAKVAGGLMEEIQSRPGGIGEVLQSFHQNGMTGLVQQWAGGETQPASPSDIETGLGSSGIVDSIAQRTGLSPTAVKTGLAVIVPVVIKHMASSGHVTPEGQSTGTMPDTGGLLQSVLGHIM